MALKRFFEDSKKERLYVNVVSEAATLTTFKDTTLLKEPNALAQVLEANSGISERDCDVQFLEALSGTPFQGNGPLLVNCFKRSDYLRAQAISGELGFERFELFNNTLSILGALNDWRKEFGSRETVAVLEVGITASTVTLSLPDGQIVSKKVPVSIQDLAEGIQKKLQLKFESAALLLFYNGVFDFTQHKEAISATFSEKLNPYLQNLSGKFGEEIDRLLITSLPPSYSWLNEEIPSAIGLKGFAPDEFYFLKDLSTLGECSSNAGFIGTAFCAHSDPDSEPWMVSIKMQSIEEACKNIQGFSAPAAVTNVIQAPEVHMEEVVEEETPTFEIEDLTENNSIESVKEPPLFSEEEITEVAPNVTDIFGDSEVEEIILAETKADPIEVITFNESKKEEPGAPKVEKEVSPINEEENDKSKLGLIFLSLAAMMMLGGGAFFYFQSSETIPVPIPVPLHTAELIEPDNAIDTAPIESNQDIIEVTASITEEPTQTITNPATADTDNLELDSVDLFDTIETSSEPEIVALPAQPILPLGALQIDSTPAGASVFLNGKEKGKTPLTVDELQFGEYAVEFKLPGYVTMLLDVSVHSEEVDKVSTELQLPIGTLEIQTTPEGIAYKVVSVEGLDRVVHSGFSPATIPDLIKGEYEILFTRDNWEDYSERVEVRFNDVSRVDLVYPEGWIMVTSIPDNASVFEKGQYIGKTPLRLKGLKEGEIQYTIRQDGYEDFEASTTIVAQTEKYIEAELLSWDREVNYNQLDTPPIQVKSSLTYTQRLTGKDSHRFLVEFVINKEGSPEQIEVLETTYLRAHERLIKDVSKWVFDPGMRTGRAVKTRVRLPIILGDAAKLPPAVELARQEKDEE